MLAAALAAGLAFANAGRIHAVGLVAAAVAAVAVVVVDAPAARLAVLAAVLALLGWWWASARLDALDRSPLLAEVGRAGRATVVVTAPPAEGQFSIRAQGHARSFRGRPVDESVQLELPLGRSPPQGAILDALVVVKLPPGPEHGFDERTWLRRRGVHVIFKVDDWKLVGARGGLGGLADRLRERLAALDRPRPRGRAARGPGGDRPRRRLALSPRAPPGLPGLGALPHPRRERPERRAGRGGRADARVAARRSARWIGELGALAGIGATCSRSGRSRR